MKKFVLFLILAFLPIGFSHAEKVGTPISFHDYMGQLYTIGSGRLEIMSLDIYDATLYASGEKWQANQPFALQIHYFLEFSGKQLAELSAQEMLKHGNVDQQTVLSWKKQMEQIFPVVEKNSELVGVRDKNGSILFYKNGKNIGTIKDPLFGKHFFDIWLHENSSFPKLRKQLLGHKI